MKTTLLIIALLCSLCLSAQEKAIKKIEKAYSKAKYERCIAIAQKKSKKFRREPAFPLYAGLCYYQIAVFSDRQTSRKNYIKKALKYVARAKGKVRNESQLDAFREDLANVYSESINLAAAEYKNKNSRTARSIYSLIAKAYGDTLPEYKAILEARKKKLEKKPIKKTVSLKAEAKKNKQPSLYVSTDQLISRARSFVGVKYKWGGESPSGFDCSGFNTYLYRQAGVPIPHNAQRQSQLGRFVKIEEAKPGDLIFFGKKNGSSYSISHTGMVYSNKQGKIKIIHCPNRGVTIEGEGDVSWDKYWKKRYLFTKRII